MKFDYLIEVIGYWQTNAIAIVVRSSLILFLVFMCMWFIKQIIEPMPQNDLEKYLYSDYMEIIKELIKEKHNKQCKR